MSTWIRSIACSVGTCVEVRHIDGRVEVRDNTAPDTVLPITPADWAVFLVGAKAGEFDGPAADDVPARGELIADPSTLNLGDRVEWDVLLPRGPYVATGVVTQQGTGVFIYEDNPPRWGVWTLEEATNLRRPPGGTS